MTSNAAPRVERNEQHAQIKRGESETNKKKKKDPRKRKQDAQLTAISGLSAKTNSWAGEGSRFRGGGDGSFSRAALPLDLVKNFRIPVFFVSCSDSESLGGGGEREESDDRSERSSLSILNGIYRVGEFPFGLLSMYFSGRCKVGVSRWIALLQRTRKLRGKGTWDKFGPHTLSHYR